MTIHSKGKEFKSALHQTARNYAKANIPVFPCHPRTKKPATPNGYLDATTDLEKIDQWWQEPDYNVAMCPEMAGWAVVDVEHDAAPDWPNGQPLPETYTVSTPRGGTHRIYEGSLPSTVAKLAPRVDTRSVGGYILVPPSIVFDEKTGKTGRYKVIDKRDPVELPAWITAALAKKASKAKARAGVKVNDPHNIRCAVTYLQGLSLAKEKDGCDAKTEAAAAWMHDFALSEDKAADVMEEHYKAEPRDHRFRAFLERKIANAYKYAQNEFGSKAVPPLEVTYGHIVAKLIEAGDVALEGEPASAGGGLIMRPFSEIPMEKLEWMWPNRFPRGKLSLTAGDPKLGKTTALLSIASIVTRGGEWPNGEGRAERGSVIYFSAEDTPSDTLKPRLLAARADMTKIFNVDAVATEDGKGTKTFHLQEDLARLERELDRVGDVALVVFDPISSYFGKTDTYRNTEVRGVLEPLVKLAARRRIAIIGNTHLTKGSKGRASMRILDSVAMTAAVRSVYMVVEDADDKRQRFFVSSGGNLGKPVDGLRFTIDSKFVTADDVTVTGSFVVWGDAIETTADEAYAAIDANAKGDSAVDEAMDFLKEELAAGPCDSAKVYWNARAAGHAEKTLKRAIKRLGVVSSKNGMAGGWTMRLR
jgi:putative DNA primase/helicase